ncbi:hypothetical protein HDU76_001019 [Blyttiomyces sp. JEL0837]|nr:hypothetical protein HDU76_001019 [Blyttiomyces sp. JEL0837]
MSYRGSTGHGRRNARISISDYLRRIVKYASIEKSVLLLVLIYIDRICEQHRSFTISSLTSHRFLISAITAGSKAVSDIYCTNTHFAKVGGITLQELNLLEIEFCTMITWKLACNHNLLQTYYVNLVRTSSHYFIGTAQTAATTPIAPTIGAEALAASSTAPNAPNGPISSTETSVPTPVAPSTVSANASTPVAASVSSVSENISSQTTANATPIVNGPATVTPGAA